jgi:long-chain acyl-CoA synthetase
MSEILKQLNFQCLYFRNESYDQTTIENAIDHLAKYLQKNLRSLSPFILFSANNHIKTVIAYYAILKAGKIAVILDPLLKKLEYDETFNELCPAAVININVKTTKFDYKNEMLFYENNGQLEIKSDLRDVCTLAYTNAEDGYSKAAMLTEKNLIMEAMGLKETTYLYNSSVSCALLPYSHLYGFAHGVLTTTMANGKGLIEEVNLLNMDKIVSVIKDAGVTHLYTVPSVYYILGKMTAVAESMQQVQRFYSGGIQLSAFIYDNFYKKTGKKIFEGYGLTEASPAVAGPYDNPVFGSFGRAFPGCEIKIMNDGGKECTPGEMGEIRVKGDMVFKGYFNHPEATRAVLRDEWLFTGDIGKKDSDGNIYFCGLKKNMINIAGNKLYPNKLVRLFKMHNNVVDASIGSEVSLLQGSTPTTRILLKISTKKHQEEFKQWCYSNINNTLLPKIWNFE